MTKQLKENGYKISAFQALMVPFNVESGETYEKISLDITVDSIVYSYEIHRDDRHPDINRIKYHLESSLTKAQSEMLNVTIREYKERDYLFVDFQDIGQQQYTGRRTA